VRTYRNLLLVLARALRLPAAGLTVWVLATLLITAVAWRSYGPFHPVIAYFIYAAAEHSRPASSSACLRPQWRGSAALRRVARSAPRSGWRPRSRGRAELRATYPICSGDSSRLATSAWPIRGLSRP